jgi:hypothetical protein
MSDTWARRAPWTGIAAGIIALVAIIIGGETPDFDASPREVLNYYDDDVQFFAAAMFALVAVLFTFFAATLRSRMRSAESLSNLTLIGGALFAVGIAVFSAINFTLADLADSDKQIDPGALQALNAANSDFFFPAIVGLAVFYFSTALAILSTGAMPRWWGWITLVLGILAIAGPLGFAAFVLTLPWIVIAAILLLMQGDETAPAPPTPGPAP